MERVRVTLLLAALTLVAAACGDAGAPVAESAPQVTAGDDGTTAADAPATTGPAADTPATTGPAGDASEDDAGVANRPLPRPDGPAAPAIDLVLHGPEGEAFSLAAEEKPVYLVFWAEW